MSDDLVQRLRLRHPQGRPPHSIGRLLEVLHAERDEAADRIEQLEAERADLIERLGRAARQLDGQAHCASVDSLWNRTHRLHGKADGVRLALSYIEEARRG